MEPEWSWFAGSPQLLEAIKGGSIDSGLPVRSAPGQVAVGKWFASPNRRKHCVG